MQAPVANAPQAKDISLSSVAQATIIPAYNVSAVDTIAAGDAFNGSFGWGLVQENLLWTVHGTPLLSLLFQ